MRAVPGGVLVLALLAGSATGARARATDSFATDPRLQAAVERAVRGAPGGVGVAVRALDGPRGPGAAGRPLGAGVNQSRPRPMGSVFKLPVALAVLGEVDRGRLRLGDSLALGPGDMEPGWSPIAERFPAGGVSFTVHDLLDSMLVRSDNTACDVLLGRIGGPSAVRARLRDLGCAGVRVDRSELEMGAEWYGVGSPPTGPGRSRAALLAARDHLPDSVRARAARAFSRDPRDTASPAALVDLLGRAWHGGGLGPRRGLRDTLFAMMRRCATGAARLRAGVPPDAEVFDKTGSGGTWAGVTLCVNDAGILTLRDGTHAAVAVLVQDVHGPPSGAERLIAGVARVVWETWGNPKGANGPGVLPGRR